MLDEARYRRERIGKRIHRLDLADDEPVLSRDAGSDLLVLLLGEALDDPCGEVLEFLEAPLAYPFAQLDRPLAEHIGLFYVLPVLLVVGRSHHLGALEHHVLEQVGYARYVRTLVGRSDVEQGRHKGDGRLVSFDDEEGHAVVELEFPHLLLERLGRRKALQQDEQNGEREGTKSYGLLHAPSFRGKR